jgi:hypothetical protein
LRQSSESLRFRSLIVAGLVTCDVNLLDRLGVTTLSSIGNEGRYFVPHGDRIGPKANEDYGSHIFTIANQPEEQIFRAGVPMA